MQNVQEQSKLTSEPASLNRIRVETALSRFPIHRLAKKDTVTIDLQQVGQNGEPDFKWEVTYNQKHGQPGPLAYKVDTLIVNRRIDAAGRPLPGVIKLGSLTELCTALGISDSGENRSNIKKALHQNASAYITAKIRYRTKTGKEKWSEIGYTRYLVIFTGETLPDGVMADAVYIVPNASYRDLLNHVEVRPLDYDYLTSLTPGAQRLYELLSFQMYGALAGGRPRAKLLYSEYCTHAPQARYFDFDRVKKQMFKLHVPHREAAYIAKVDYEMTIDGEGAPDWEMLYTPGSKAIGEYESFTRRQLHRLVEVAPLPTPPAERSVPAEIASTACLGYSADNEPLLHELTKRGISDSRARDLLTKVQPNQEVLDQLEYVDELVAKDVRLKITNPPGLYIKYVSENILPPVTFVGSRRRGLIAKARENKQVETARLTRLRLNYESYCRAETERYISESLPVGVYQQLYQSHLRQNQGLFSHLSEAQLHELTTGTVLSELQHSGQVPILTYEAFSGDSV